MKYEEKRNYLESLEGTDSTNTMDINPTEYGYMLIKHYQPGVIEVADIAEELRELGVKRFLFNIDKTRKLSLYVHKQERQWHVW